MASYFHRYNYSCLYISLQLITVLADPNPSPRRRNDDDDDGNRKLRHGHRKRGGRRNDDRNNDDDDDDDDDGDDGRDGRSKFGRTGPIHTIFDKKMF